MVLSKVPKDDYIKKYDYHVNLFSRLGNFFMNLGLLEAAQRMYKRLIKQLEDHYKESHGTVVYNPFNHSWCYRCKHPEVLKVHSLFNSLTHIVPDKRRFFFFFFLILHENFCFGYGALLMITHNMFS